VAKRSVLVLLAAFNGSRWIETQLASILRQSDVDVRVLASDDHSTDSTPALIDGLRPTGRVARISFAAPSGSAAQNFFSLIRAVGSDGADYVAFADQDDEWYENKLSRACELLGSKGGSGYSSAVNAVWENGRSHLITLRPSRSSSDFLVEGGGQGCTFVLSSDFYERMRAFVAGHRDLTARIHYHDWCVYALARVWGLNWVFDPSPTMSYRQHAGNHTGARASLAGFSQRLARIRRGWYAEQLRAIADLCHTAAPEHPVVHAWRAQLLATRGFSRRLGLAWFCARGGRRRVSDNLVLTLSALAGWL
jgi:rhamnosyltransferase